MNNPDPLASIIAKMITGVVREHGNDGPWLLLKGKPSDDGREITVDVFRYDFTDTTVGEQATRRLIHLSSPMPLDTEPAKPCTNGTVDPVISTPDGSAT